MRGRDRIRVGMTWHPPLRSDGVAANDELTFALALIIVFESQEKGQKFATFKR